jgi:hypothetical protein
MPGATNEHTITSCLWNYLEADEKDGFAEWDSPKKKLCIQALVRAIEADDHDESVMDIGNMN